MKTYLLSPTIVALVFLSFNVPATVLYVDLNSTNPVSPYADWTTAATSIQDAVDAATNGDSILVTNGVYQTGGAGLVFQNPLGGRPYTESNRVAVTKAVMIQSVNGAAVTFIQGYQVPGTTNGLAALRCIYLTNGAALSGFTLMNGATRIRGSGGGAFCFSNATVFDCTISNNAADSLGGGVFGGTLSNCILVQNSASRGGGAESSTLNNCLIAGNSASSGGGAYSAALNHCALTGNSAGDGGGVFDSLLNNCTLTGNWATNYGGGVMRSTLNNCTLASNSAGNGGGASSGSIPSPAMVMNNCIIYYNTASSSANYDLSTLNYCCTTPLPTGGAGNITN